MNLPILATVTTCPQRWTHYRRFLKNFAALRLGFPVRTFQTKEAHGNPFANNNLNARAALAYAERNLSDNGWLLYLEDDVVMRPVLAALLPQFMAIGERQRLDCWYLCNRKNMVERQFRRGAVVINELAELILGSHALLIPKRHLKTMLDAHWAEIADRSMFGALRREPLKVWQVVEPVLVRHVGFVSTYDPEQKPRELEVNYAN
ncbi:MAG TPA: hypothetical protein VMZ27_18230 [Candidatus Saccharimonadales bacterium]|nr:hypothetical protein [Candidatus Saccharimonadales bacterium]